MTTETRDLNYILHKSESLVIKYIKKILHSSSCVGMMTHADSRSKTNSSCVRLSSRNCPRELPSMLTTFGLEVPLARPSVLRDSVRIGAQRCSSAIEFSSMAWWRSVIHGGPLDFSQRPSTPFCLTYRFRSWSPSSRKNVFTKRRFTAFVNMSAGLFLPRTGMAESSHVLLVLVLGPISIWFQHESCARDLVVLRTSSPQLLSDSISRDTARPQSFINLCIPNPTELPFTSPYHFDSPLLNEILD